MSSGWDDDVLARLDVPREVLDETIVSDAVSWAATLTRVGRSAEAVALLDAAAGVEGAPPRQELARRARGLIFKRALPSRTVRRGGARARGLRSRPMTSILQVNASDVGGGAEVVSLALHRAFRALGHDACLAVGHARSGEDGIVQIGDGRSRRSRALRDPGVLLDVARGHEDFRFPASRGVLDLPPQPPDVLHVHNLHGGYFDLRLLPRALGAAANGRDHARRMALQRGTVRTRSTPSAGREGCGSCPHLDSYPALRVDGTAENWQRKAALYEHSRFHVVCPSAWLLERAQRSMLAPAIASARVIPNGVDVELFAPERRAERDEPVVLFAAQGARTNKYKDFRTLRSALELLRDRRLLAVALGEAAPEERIGAVTLRSEPFETHEEVAARFRGADLYVHAARADNRPSPCWRRWRRASP